jgi:exodeoxyribonuclease VII large subunit
MPDLDALVLIRGGGSLEDLQSFNDEKLARTIFSSKVPVVCGVGHEDDLTIADLVADLRASTPSNAAELLAKTRDEIWMEASHSLKILNSYLKQNLDGSKSDLKKKVVVLEKAIAYQIYFAGRAKDKILSQFSLLKQRLSNLFKERAYLQSRLFRSLDYLIFKEKEKAESLVKYFSSFDVRKVLARGFSLTFNEKGEIIRSIKSVSKKSLITTNLLDGKIASEVLRLEKI